MAYSTSGLRRVVDGSLSLWVYDTADSVATACGSGYFTDGVSSTTNSTPGRGMNVGDPVLIRVVGAVTSGGKPPATCTDQAWAYVSGVDLATGYATTTLTHTNA